MNIDEMTVLGPNGELRTIGDIRKKRAGVIVLVRHFGCIFCRQRVAQLVQEAENQSHLNLCSLVIGNGTPLMAADFVEHHNIQTPVYTDPSRKVYTELGMHRRFGLNYQTLKQSLTAYKAGHRQTKVQGDVWQQGGVVTFDRSGQVIFRAADKEAGSDIPWAEVWQSLAQTGTNPPRHD